MKTTINILLFILGFVAFIVLCGTYDGLSLTQEILLRATMLMTVATTVLMTRYTLPELWTGEEDC